MHLKKKYFNQNFNMIAYRGVLYIQTEIRDEGETDQ